MKLQKCTQIIISFVIIGCSLFALVKPSHAQIQPIQFTQDELDQFQSQGYIVKNHLPYEVYNRLIFGKVHPMHAEFGSTIVLEAHNDINGRFSVLVKQDRPIQSLDGQRLLDVTCCLNLYTSRVNMGQLEFRDSFKTSISLPSLKKTQEDGTFNSKMNILVFPDY